jgi:hypothetical protein
MQAAGSNVGIENARGGGMWKVREQARILEGATLNVREQAMIRMNPTWKKSL